MKLSMAVLAAILTIGNPASFAATITIYDDTFDVLIGGSTFTTANSSKGITGGVIAGVWGTWNSSTSTFTPVIGSWGQGYGYVAPDPELNIQLNQTSLGTGLASTAYGIAPNSLLALGIYNGPENTGGWSTSVAYAVLTDASWTAPEWTGGDKSVNFTANTVARVGEFTFASSGNDVIALVPEPSTGALMMIGAVGLVALRRLRKV